MKRPFHILFIIDELDIGGTETQIYELIRNLDSNRYQSSVCCFRERGHIARQIESLGVPVYLVEKRSKIDPRFLVRLVRLCRQLQVDLVQTYLITANIWGALAAKLAGIHIVVASERNVHPTDKGSHPVANSTFKHIARFADSITGNCEAVSRYLVRDLGTPKKKVVTIHNGIDVERLSMEATLGYDQLLSLSDRNPTIVKAARLVRQKNHPMLLRAIPLVLKTSPDLRVLLLGAGPLESAYKEMVSQLQINDHVSFLGSREDTPALLNCADVSVLTSDWEGCSNVIMESMALGKPVIATDVGGNSELVVHGETGYLIPPGDVNALAERMIDLFSNPRRSKSMGVAGRKRVKKLFDAQMMVKKTDQLYMRLLNEKPGTW